MSLVLGPGAVVAGRYRLDRLLGRGGMGQVWAVTHEVTLRTAALKLLNAAAHQRADRRRRFLREARAASAVQHPNVVQIHDFFELGDGTPVMVMDLLEGETLAERLKRDGALPLADAVDALLPVISAVGTAHALGIVHRDLKPDNVFLSGCRSGTHVRVLDFGIAKLMKSAVDDSDEGLTGTGAVLGTPRYMSPEQSFGDASVDHRADIWSIGVMLYEALAGSRPIEGENLGKILQRLISEGITPLRVLQPDLPEAVLDLVDRMLTRDPASRPADLREVHAVLSPHGTVTVPAFDAAIAERELAPVSNPLSALRPDALVEVVSGTDTVLDVSDAHHRGPAPLDVEFSLAHALSARNRQRNRRWSFVFGVTLLVVAAALVRHFVVTTQPASVVATVSPTPQAVVASSVAAPPHAVAADAPPAPPAVAADAPPAPHAVAADAPPAAHTKPAPPAAPEARTATGHTVREAARQEPQRVVGARPSAVSVPVTRPSVLPTPVAPRTGLVDEPPF
jgi:serine/threonine-protein kinase